MSGARRRSRAFVLGLAVVAIAGACGSSAASTSAAGPGGSSRSILASIAPAVTSSVAAPSAAADSVVARAVAAFSGLSSYRFDVTMHGGSYAAVLAPHGMQGTVANSPSFAVEFSYVDLEVIQTQDKIWQKNGARWDLANADYPTGKTTFDSFGPPVLFAHDLTPMAAYYTAVGAETVNGVATTHYTCNPKALGFFSGVYGFKGDATVAADVWVANSGGYVAKFEIKASGTDTFDLTVLISKANDPGNVIHVPA